MIIDFAIWAPDEATFWQSWIKRGLAIEPYQFNSAFEIIITDETSQSWMPGTWSGKEREQEFTKIPGWHANIRVTGPTAEKFVHILNLDKQPEGKTPEKAIELVSKERDEETKFPAGYQDDDGIVYTDKQNINTPTNVWA
jgi:hypothetical protein